MAVSFFDKRTRKKREQMLAVDLGSRVTKAVHLQRSGDGFALCGFALLDAPIFDKALSVELLAEHLSAVGKLLNAKTRLLALTVGINDALLRHVEMPPMPMSDMRQVLRINSRNYLQQDLSGHVFDCCAAVTAAAAPLPAPANGKAKDAVKPPAQKQKTLVGGAKRQLIDDFLAGAKRAGFVADHVVPGVLGPVNAFELAQPELFAKSVVALVDIGFRSSSIAILQEGELALNRVVNIGGDKLTAGLAEQMNINYAEAEGIKVGMPQEVQTALEGLLVPLGRELRASLDFYEHQHDRTVSQVFLSGGSAQSECVVQTLRQELMVECTTWNPTSFLKIAVPERQAAELPQVAGQLAVAVGAALTAL